MMTNSFIPYHACAANRCNTQGWACLGTWLRGWAAWLNHSVWPVIRLLSGGSALSSGRSLRSLAFKSSTHLLLQCVWWWKHISPICHRMSVSIPFRSYTCQCLAEDCAFDISMARRQSDGRCHFCVPIPKISLEHSQNSSTWTCVSALLILYLMSNHNHIPSMYLWK